MILVKLLVTDGRPGQHVLRMEWKKKKFNLSYLHSKIFSGCLKCTKHQGHRDKQDFAPVPALGQPVRMRQTYLFQAILHIRGRLLKMHLVAFCEPKSLNGANLPKRKGQALACFSSFLHLKRHVLLCPHWWVRLLYKPTDPDSLCSAES